MLQPNLKMKMNPISPVLMMIITTSSQDTTTTTTTTTAPGPQRCDPTGVTVRQVG